MTDEQLETLREEIRRSHSDAPGWGGVFFACLLALFVFQYCGGKP